MRLRTFVLIYTFLFTPFNIWGEHSTQLKTDNEINQNKIVEKNIPLFEQYNWSDNYLINQPITNIFRWTPMGSLLGFSIGGIEDIKTMNENGHIFIPASAIGALIGTGVGFLTGTTIGFVRGVNYNNIKKDNTDFHLRRYKFGYMIVYEIAPLNTSNKKNYKGVSRYSDDMPGMLLIFRSISDIPFLPDKFEIGWGKIFWGRTSNYEIPTVARLYLQKVELNALYSIYSLKLFSIKGGLGIGYNWGKERTYNQINDIMLNDIETKNIKSVFVKLIIGTEFNIFDFIFTDISFQFEPLGIYQQIKHKDNYSFIQNFTIRFSAGSYIF